MKAAVVTFTLAVVLLAAIAIVESQDDKCQDPAIRTCSDATDPEDCKGDGTCKNGLDCYGDGECCNDWCKTDLTHSYPGKCACDDL